MVSSRGFVAVAGVAFVVCVVLGFGVTPAAAVDPTVCRTWTNQAYDCNCYSCQCETCYTCGCSATKPWGSCSYGSCDGSSDCWCSPICKCCRDSACSYTCNCKQCCNQCTRLVCTNTYAYSVSSVTPAIAPTTGGSVITVTGVKFYTPSTAKCRFSITPTPVIVAAAIISETEIHCVLPTVVIAGTGSGTAVVNVEVSMDGGTSWTDNSRHLTLYQCAGQMGSVACRGNGTCETDAECTCKVGKWGTDCSSDCPGGFSNPCSGKSIYPDCNWDGTCNCQPGYWGTACQSGCLPSPSNPCNNHGTCLSDGTCHCNTPWVGNDCSRNRTCTATSCTCPVGTYGPACADTCTCDLSHSTCDATTGDCYCSAGYWGTNCDHVCVGTSVTGPGGPIVPCSAHGTCTTAGDCFCDSGYYGAACNMTCPGGPNAPCNNHAVFGNCNDDGTCSCQHGWWGPNCMGTCPGGEATPCSMHGECSSEYGTCNCDPGWAGADCSIQCAGPIGHPCNDRGLCNGADGTCACVAGWWGANCTQQCASSPLGVCSGRGVCPNGVCVCPGYWGSTCENTCPGDITPPGGATTPCNGHGSCDQTFGTCTCSPGYYGSDCAGVCIGGATNPCSGHGTCNHNDGTCLCNAPWSGPDCSTAGCLNDCNGHGTCAPGGGVCNCNPGWLPPWCSQTPAPPSGPNPGKITFGSSAVTVRESSSSVIIPIYRVDGKNGPVQAVVATTNDTATPGADYQEYQRIFYWADQDNSTQQVIITILEDQLPEADETLIVNITGTSGGAIRGAKPTVIVTILANDAGQHPDGDLVEIIIRLNLSITLIPDHSSAQTRFKNQILADIASAVDCASSRLGVDMLWVDSNDDSGVFFQFHFLPSTNPSDPKPAELAARFLEKMKDARSSLYNGEASQYIDGSVPPIVSSKVVGPSDDDGGSDNHLVIAIGVSIGVIALAGVCCVTCYVKRKPIADWLLWKLGNFRFNRFRENEHAGAGASDSAELQDNRPMPLASAASGADTLTLAEPDSSDSSINRSPTHPASNAAAESAKLTLSSDSERAGAEHAHSAGVGHETLDAMPPSGNDPARDL